MEVLIAPAIVQQAARWMARLWSDDASDEDQAECARWRAAHPHHDLAWQRLQAFEGKLHSVPRAAYSMPPTGNSKASTFRARRRFR